MVVVSAGKIIRFDDVRGYGFIAPVGGGEDVFFHANDFGENRHLLQVGLTVRYEAIAGDRGPKVLSVRIVDPADSGIGPAPDWERRAVSAADDDGMCDVLASREFLTDVTEMLLRHVPSLTGTQIIEVRKQFVDYGRAHGWVEN
ncbi:MULTISPECIES: cold shock domain-containing protein [unclassified Nonomuraea]|uniref:cold shock domain-containing protein n=1 Tax=unclassified Nonomuraea TaxID=2593643 RepID=UPI0035C1F008